jgi:hypothetical protein
MKLLALFMTIVAIGLSLVPCCAPGEQAYESVSTESCCQDRGCNDQANEADTKNDNTCSSCSPFFACGSCIGFTFQSFDFVFRHVDMEFGSYYFSYTERFNSEYFAKKWQPPKIV